MKKNKNILYPNQSMKLEIKAQTPDYEAMKKRGDKWYHFWRPTIWKELTNEELKGLIGE